jgi:hypothetical protein
MAKRTGWDFEDLKNRTTIKGNFVSRLKGINNLIDKLKRCKEAHGHGFEVGLEEWGFLIQRESMELVPVEFGPLRLSAYTRKDGHGFATVIVVGYTALYAIFVHENLAAAHGFRFNMKYAAEIAAGTEKARGENQTAKFLEIPFRRFQDDGLEIVKARMIEYRKREIN